MTELKVSAVVKSPTDQVAAAPPLTTFGELIECLDIVSGISRMPEDTSRPGSGHMRLHSTKPQSTKRITPPRPCAESDLPQIKYAMPVEPVRFYYCILPHKPITILKSDSDEEMVPAAESVEELIRKLIFLKIYGGEKQFVFLFCYLSALS